jgi:hypothetical protein
LWGQSLATFNCAVWSLALGEEHRLKVFGKKVLTKILKPEGDEVMGTGE